LEIFIPEWLHTQLTFDQNRELEVGFWITEDADKTDIILHSMRRLSSLITTVETTTKDGGRPLLWMLGIDESIVGLSFSTTPIILKCNDSSTVLKRPFPVASLSYSRYIRKATSIRSPGITH
jgi:hypothetical protein